MPIFFSESGRPLRAPGEASGPSHPSPHPDIVSWQCSRLRGSGSGPAGRLFAKSGATTSLPASWASPAPCGAALWQRALWELLLLRPQLGATETGGAQLSRERRSTGAFFGVPAREPARSRGRGVRVGDGCVPRAVESLGARAARAGLTDATGFPCLQGPSGRVQGVGQSVAQRDAIQPPFARREGHARLLCPSPGKRARRACQPALRPFASELDSPRPPAAPCGDPVHAMPQARLV